MEQNTGNSMRVLYAGQIEIWNGWLGMKPENRNKTIRVRREPTTNSTHIWQFLVAATEPGPYWWKVSALTTAPFKLHIPNSSMKRR